MLVAGVDESGRGPLAGPIIAAAVILDHGVDIPGLKDSKKIRQSSRREDIAGMIMERALFWAIGRAEVHEIDEVNAFKASMLAMRRAVKSLPVIPDLVQVDGNARPCALGCPSVAVIAGDGKIDAISAASIITKVTRDAEMEMLSDLYPEYNFYENKGYSTFEHLMALKKLGPSPMHRISCKPVRKSMKNTAPHIRS